MGEVYRARDPKLGRDVAIKVLPAAVTSDPDRLSRFTREARLLASLNHPNIGAIYEVEDAGGVQGLVLELIEGPTLSDRLSRGALPIREALGIARQIADGARGRARERDRPSGSQAGQRQDHARRRRQSDRLRHRERRRAGRLPPPRRRQVFIIGTAAYMSPEQARGGSVDKRTDIWAFGCVLYEMLTGQQPFDADTSSDTIARILEHEPAWDRLPAAVPPGIRKLLKRCLNKDPADRLHDIADARLEIVEALSDSPTRIDQTKASTGSRQSWLWIALAAAAAVTVSMIWWALSRPSAPTQPVPPVEFGVRFPDNYIPATGLAVSPDGRHIAVGVFANASQIWLHSLDSFETRPIAGTENAQFPFWSPDGSRLGFSAGGKLVAIDVAGGSSAVICELPLAFQVVFGAAWNTSGVIVFPVRNQLFQVQASGGVPTPIPLTGKIEPAFPQFLPDQRHFIFYDGAPAGGGFDPCRVVGWRRHQAARRLRRAWCVCAAQPLALHSRGGADDPDDGPEASHARRESETRGGERLSRRPVRLSSERVDLGDRSTGLREAPRWKRGRVGVVRPDRTAGRHSTGASGRRVPCNPSISPNGQQIAVNLMDPRTGDWDIWTIDVARGVPSRLTSDPDRDSDPVWSPDGKEIVFASNRGGVPGLYRKAVDGSSVETLIDKLDGVRTVVPSDWSRDGKYILYDQGTQEGRSVRALPLFGDRKPIVLVDERFSPYAAHLSPDGQWMAYGSFKTGPGEIYVRRFLVPGQELQISTGGGVHPRWTADGRELVYWAVPRGIDAVSFEATGSTFRVGPRRTLVQPPVLSLIDARTHYDITRDGKRLLVRQPAGPQQVGLTVILNWMEKLK